MKKTFHSPDSLQNADRLFPFFGALVEGRSSPETMERTKSFVKMSMRMATLPCREGYDSQILVHDFTRSFVLLASFVKDS